jgi:hypothetical protein
MKTLRRLSIAALLALLLTNLVGPPAWAASVNCITTDSATGSTITGSFTITDNVVTGHTNCAGSAVVPTGVTSIGDLAFDGASLLSSISMPNTVTSIGGQAFRGASSLTSITIPKSVTSIGSTAFQTATNLASITFDPESKLTTIGPDAFVDTAIQTIAIPTSLTSIGYAAFAGARFLTSVTIPNSVTSIGDRAFDGASSLKAITIPKSVISIGNFAFRDNTALQAVTFETDSQVTSLPYALFWGATALSTITIPNSVTDIGEFAFYYATSLASITIPSSVTSIGEGAFWNATSLSSITFDGNAPQDRDIFRNVKEGAVAIISPSFAPSFGSDPTWKGLTLAVLRNVTFNENGGTGTMSSQVAAVTKALTTNTFTRDGFFTFAGWNTAINGSGVSYSPGADYSFASDATLYAQWTAIPASPPASEPAPNPAPLNTTAPEPTPPTQRASTPGGTVAGSADKLIFSAGTSGGTITARGSDWQLEIASVQGDGKANPATGDSNLVFQPSSKVELSANGLMPSAKVAFWVFSDPTFVGEVETDSTGKFESNLVLPDGLAPGEHTLQVLSRDSKGRAITLNFPILVQGEEAYETVSISQKVNAGSFNRSIAVYAKGHKGKTLSWKTAGKWSRKTITSDYQVFQRRTAAVGLDVNVQLYINGEKQSTKTVRTR